MKKRMIILSSVLLVVLVGYLALRWADRNGRFDLYTARIDNSGPVDSALVAELLEPCFGRSLLELNRDSLEGELAGIEGLRSVSVTFSYPHTIIVKMEPERSAAMIETTGGTYPVSFSGSRLPERWADESLPVLTVNGNPCQEFLAAGLDLLLKRRIEEPASVSVSARGIVVLDNSIPVLLNGARAAEGWNTWESIRSSVPPTAAQVDLRYSGQAVIRHSRGAEV